MAGISAIHYAQALFEIAVEQQCLVEMKEQLRQICAAMESSPILREVLQSPKVSKEEKKKLVNQLFSCQHWLNNFLQLLIDKGRIGEIRTITREYVRLTNQQLHIAVATVMSACPLKEAEKEQIQAILARRTGMKIELDCRIDPHCLAGIRVECMGEVLDNTFASRLEGMKEKIAAATVQ